MSDAAVSHYREEYERTRSGRPGSGLGDEAIAWIEAQGFPNRKQESWKYTDVKNITRRRFFTTGSAEPDKKLLQQARISGLDCHELVFMNGVCCVSPDSGPLPPGVSIESMADVLKREPGLLKQVLPAADSAFSHAFSALNLAFLTGGACIRIGKDVELDRPVNLIFLANQQAEPVAAHPFVLIQMEANSSATVIETFVGSAGAEYFTNTQTRITTASGARLEHYRIQQESLQAFHVGHTAITQERDSSVVSHAIALGSALARNDIIAGLDGPGASIVMNGLYMTAGKQHIDNHTRVDHLQPRTGSQEHYRGVMNGHSRAVFNGKVVVHEQAQKTEAHQSNANLLLSSDAEVDTKPELEIYNDDVKCSHGATVGQLDEKMLFYLRTRAIDEDTARSLLTWAFTEEVIRHIAIAPIRERLEFIVAGKLPDTELIKEFMS